MASTELRHVVREPRARRDGKCVVCKKDKPTPADPKGIYRVDLDPFCSTQCCRKYYDTEDKIMDSPLTRERCS